MCTVKSSYQYVGWSLISCVWRVCKDGIVHDGGFSACHASLCFGGMFICCFSYLDHLAPKSGQRSGDFYNWPTLLQMHHPSIQDITHMSTALTVHTAAVWNVCGLLLLDWNQTEHHHIHLFNISDIWPHHPEQPWFTSRGPSASVLLLNLMQMICS